MFRWCPLSKSVNKSVISLCDKTGIMVKPWARAGYQCYCVDVQHSIRKDRVEKYPVCAAEINGQMCTLIGEINYVWGDVRSWLPPDGVDIGIVFAFPPCTHLTCSDARDFRKKGGWMLHDGLMCFDACNVAGRYSGAPYMTENPIGRLNTHRRPPDYKFHPWQYGDPYTKNTGIWCGNGFIMPPPTVKIKPAEATSKMHEMPPSDDRANLRSETPAGFAEAVFRANRKLLK